MKMRYELIHADCRDVMANMGDNSVDSICTDPPYHLTSIVKRFGPGQAPAQYGTDGAFARASRGFMGQEWDGGDIAFDPALWAECLRVLKPGGHLIAFSGSRTYHRMAYAIDLAGFEIRDQLLWLYGSGFPKSHDVSKAIEARAKTGSGRPEDIRRAAMGEGYKPSGRGRRNYDNGGGSKMNGAKLSATAPEAQQWAGWGTALKPAHEPMVLARKPLDGTVAANVLAHGTGALNIDGCRVESGADYSELQVTQGGNRAQAYGMGRRTFEPAAGRFPANVLHDGSEAILAGFPETTSGGGPKPGTPRTKVGVYGEPNDSKSPAYGSNSGSAARFFYCAKASKADREAGCAILAAEGERGNPHPTVKPTDLMRWLVRLVTPPGGLVFDPFTGSGSTGRAAMLEGCRFLGAEMTDEYVPVAHARILDALG